MTLDEVMRLDEEVASARDDWEEAKALEGKTWDALQDAETRRARAWTEHNKSALLTA